MNTQDTSTPQAAADFARRLDGIFVSIALVVAAQFRILGPWTAPIWARFNRANRRLQALLAHLAAGRLPRPHVPRAPGSRRPSAPDPMAPAPLPPLPRAWAWLVWKVGYHAAGHGSQLQTLLHDPAMLAVLAAAPTAGRTLRPFCRLLGVDLPAILQLPKRPRRPRPPSTCPPGTRPAQPRPKPPVIPPWGLPPPEPPVRTIFTDTAGIEFSFEPS